MKFWGKSKALWAKVTGQWRKPKGDFRTIIISRRKRKGFWEKARDACSQHWGKFAFLCCLAVGAWYFKPWHITLKNSDMLVHLTNEITRLAFVEWVDVAVSVFGLVISALILFFLAARVRNQEKQTASQIRKEIDERFSDAIALLGNDRTSARTGAVYALYELAVDNKKYRKRIAEILCGHIRAHTQDKHYKKAHAEHPSADVQTAIDVLFKDTEDSQGLYSKFFKDLPKANLSHAFLAGAEFAITKCEDVNFSNAVLWRAKFGFAYCKNANFSSAECQNALMWSSVYEGADFMSANCQKTNFTSSNCNGIDFFYANCQEACFNGASCQATRFNRTSCQGANFSKARCHGADFTYAECQGADFSHARCQGADFAKAHCEGAYAREFRNYAFALPLANRVGKDTELETIIVSGELDKEDFSVSKKARKPRFWNLRVWEIMEKNKGVPVTYGIPDGIISGVLEDTPEIRQIIKELDAIGEDE